MDKKSKEIQDKKLIEKNNNEKRHQNEEKTENLNQIIENLRIELSKKEEEIKLLSKEYLRIFELNENFLIYLYF